MAKPIQFDLPHKLGAAEAKRRLQNGVGKLGDHIPGGAEVQSHWTGDRLHLDVTAMGQKVAAQCDVQDDKVRLEVVLPAFLAMFGSKVEALLRKRGTDLLEDKSGDRRA